MIRRIVQLFIAFVLLAVLLSAYAYWGRNTPAFDETRSVKIPRSSGFSAIADSLDAAGLLTNRLTFTAVAGITGWYSDLKPGYYEFDEPVSNATLLRRLRKGEQTPIRVTIPPGSRPGVVAAVLRRDLEIDSSAFRNALTDPSLNSRLQTDSLHLFGYMLPETYFFYWDTDAPSVVSRLKAEFDAFFDDRMRARADSLGLTVEEVVRLASIVEWEARLDREKPIVAGVYLNRLTRGMPLQADPTVQYALMQRDEGRMRRLLFRDYDIDHPFNTYQYRGLPPGPINNPSPSSIRAVLNPRPHDYLYFVADGTGGHTFSRTLAEHNRSAAEYRRLMRTRRREQAARDQ